MNLVASGTFEHFSIPSTASSAFVVYLVELLDDGAADSVSAAQPRQRVLYEDDAVRVLDCEMPRESTSVFSAEVAGGSWCLDCSGARVGVPSRAELLGPGALFSAPLRDEASGAWWRPPGLDGSFKVSSGSDGWRGVVLGMKAHVPPALREELMALVSSASAGVTCEGVLAVTAEGFICIKIPNFFIERLLPLFQRHFPGVQAVPYFAADGSANQTKVGAHITLQLRREATEQQLARVAAELGVRAHEWTSWPGEPYHRFRFDVLGPEVRRFERDGRALLVCTVRVRLEDELHALRQRLGMSDADWRPHISVAFMELASRL